ncbi:sperm-associated antigen 4 protein-like [Harpia harpyja]|uniref:sperm-associated antigen 4 protein-like n=2 Tax=Harpia harpyja TaxID=202280 RepID=UPI0022B1D46E|nr:sperm-associated antigen 4 protein-like [Harpia harpyja]
MEELTCESAAEWKMQRHLCALLAEQNQKMQLLLEEVAQLRAEISSAKKRSQEGQEVNQAASKTALEVYVEMSDWALKSSGATIDMQRTSETYNCKENWGCRVLWFFRPANPPDTILQPDLSPGDCWPLQGPQGQVVIRLPARVHLTAVTMQHIYKEVSPSGTVTSAPRDVAVFGVDADGEEETLLGTFTYNVEKEATQTFPLKSQLHTRPLHPSNGFVPWRNGRLAAKAVGQHRRSILWPAGRLDSVLSSQHSMPLLSRCSHACREESRQSRQRELGGLACRLPPA